MDSPEERELEGRGEDRRIGKPSEKCLAIKLLVFSTLIARIDFIVEARTC